MDKHKKVKEVVKPSLITEQLHAAIEKGDILRLLQLKSSYQSLLASNYKSELHDELLNLLKSLPEFLWNLDNGFDIYVYVFKLSFECSNDQSVEHYADLLLSYFYEYKITTIPLLWTCLSETLQSQERLQIIEILRRKFDNDEDYILCCQVMSRKNKDIERIIKTYDLHTHLIIQLRPLNDKIKEFHNYSKEESYLKAIVAANQLSHNLKNLIDNYCSISHPNALQYQQFKLNCKQAIDGAHEVLDKHRGWGKILANILGIILALPFYLVVAGVNRLTQGRFTLFSTESALIINAIEDRISEVKYP